MSVVGDRDRLGQVVTNLLANAIRYNQEGGHVEVRVERVNGHAIVSVSDNGIGIPTEELPHIFERFYRVDKARTRVEEAPDWGWRFANRSWRRMAARSPLEVNRSMEQLWKFGCRCHLKLAKICKIRDTLWRLRVFIRD